MTKCSTCAYSNEWYKEREDNCGTCLSLSEVGEEFPRYKLSLYYIHKDKEEDNV